MAMNDELVTALLPSVGLRAVLATTAQLSQEGARVQKARPVAASLFAQGLTGATLLAALQKERSRINLQLECDGPLRGLFCDAGADGTVRGYLKNPAVDVGGVPGPFRWRAALGNAGYLSVLRDLGQGEFYRSSVELVAFDFAQDFERYFAVSEQVQTRVLMDVLPDGEEPLGTVVGLLLQPLPDGDRAALERLSDRLKGGAFQAAVREAPRSAAQLLTALVSGEGTPEFMSRYGLRFTCSCSRERVLRALLAMGREELQDLLEKEGRAEATCEFCTTQYVVEGPELMGLLQGSTPGN